MFVFGCSSRTKQKYLVQSLEVLQSFTSALTMTAFWLSQFLSSWPILGLGSPDSRVRRPQQLLDSIIGHIMKIQIYACGRSTQIARSDIGHHGNDCKLSWAEFRHSVWRSFC